MTKPTRSSRPNKSSHGHYHSTTNFFRSLSPSLYHPLLLHFSSSFLPSFLSSPSSLMATMAAKLFSALFLVSVLSQLAGKARSDEPCPYPCYPPPTGAGTPVTPVTTTPPSQTGSYSPPSYFPPPGGDFPFTPPPPYGGGFDVPPPPDPILPYFPFYYRKPPHQTESSAVPLRESAVMVAETGLLCLLYLMLS
ncbi:hypothetical protein BT93_L1955 [Corymbia citriodora subsp. variegata]|uniref:Uncharacterized protein n=1 Tax=Corymbia citriodora subsp. variegata TaxID=360336 RepID=A0A8T0CNQ6_CORYI|nr:hypothetical protein BT93_L1955 [Corymbia citriodora subsp. variegata]